MGNNIENKKTFYTEHDGNRGIDFHFRFCLPAEEIDLLKEIVLQRNDEDAFVQHVKQNWSHFFQMDMERIAHQFFTLLKVSKLLEIERPAIPFDKMTIDPDVSVEFGGTRN